jgi:carbonic anhydrase
LVVASSTLGVNENLVVQHTECGAASVTNEQLVEDIRRQLTFEISAVEFLPIADFRASVQADVKRVQDSPFIRARSRCPACSATPTPGRST